MAETVAFLVLPLTRFFTATGEPLAFGKLYSYESGTTTPKALYADVGGTTPLPNPTILNGAGQLLAYLVAGEAYRLDLFDANDVQQAGWPIDNITGLSVSAGAFSPVVAGSSVAGIGSYTDQVGTFLRFGPLVFFNIFLQWSIHTGSGFLVVRGFPVPAIDSAAVTVIFRGSNAARAGPIVAFLRNTPVMQIDIYMHVLSTDVLTPVSLVPPSGGGVYQLNLSGVYPAA